MTTIGGRMRQRAAVMTALASAIALAACGSSGDNGGSGSSDQASNGGGGVSDQAAIRATYGQFLTGIADDDPGSSCATLTAAGTKMFIALFNDAKVDTCAKAIHAFHDSLQGAKDQQAFRTAKVVKLTVSGNKAQIPTPGGVKFSVAFYNKDPNPAPTRLVKQNGTWKIDDVS